MRSIKTILQEISTIAKDKQIVLKAGLNPNDLSEIKKGKHKPTIKKLHKVLKGVIHINADLEKLCFELEETINTLEKIEE